MEFANLSISFWRYALETTCYILNKVSSKSVDQTPNEIWMGHRLVHSHLRVWGCPVHVKYLQKDKFGPKFDKCLFIGYPKETKGYYFYLTEKQKVFISNRTIFLEKEFLGEETNANKIELDKVYEIEEPVRCVPKMPDWLTHFCTNLRVNL